jgi:type VI protein secretion system component VasF
VGALDWLSLACSVQLVDALVSTTNFDKRGAWVGQALRVEFLSAVA